MPFAPGPLLTTAKAKRTAQEFGELMGRVVNATVSKAPIRFVEVEGKQFTGFVAHAPQGFPAPMALANGHYLYLHQALGLRRHERYLTTLEYSYRYQAAESRESWIWRYEYIREPEAGYPYPRSHVHVNARPSFYTGAKPFSELHLPVGERGVMIEALIRHLIVECDIAPISPKWEEILAEAEDSFHEIQRKRFRG